MNKNNKQNVINTEKNQESISIRIAKAVSDVKKISERILGYVSYDIQFIKATYEGTTQRPAKITPIEKGIVGILLIDGNASFERIGLILGLDVINDVAEQIFLRSAIESLRSYNAIEGNDSCFKLTDIGRIYAEKGERPDTYIKSFDIYVDKKHESWLNIKNCIGDCIDKIQEISIKSENPDLTLEQIKLYAEQQAQDVHFPQNRYILESAIWKESHEAIYRIYVCFVQSIASSNDIRAFVYDENIGGLSETFAKYINGDETLKAELLENCIRYKCDNDEESRFLKGDDVESAMLEISDEIKEAEKKLLVREEDIIAGKNIDDLEEIYLYDTLAFETKLQKIFTKDDPDEIWLISPWIWGHQNSVFFRKRGPMIQTFLQQNESKRIFVAYSAPAVTEDGSIKTDENGMPISNIDEDGKSKLEKLEKEYSNFFFGELPEFHRKRVFEVKGDNKILFSGSYNVLSFAVSETQTHIRVEDMVWVHPKAAKQAYEKTMIEFAKIYAERIKKEVEKLDEKELQDYQNDRLDYFKNIDNVEIDKLFGPLEDYIEERKLEYNKKIQSQELTKLESEISDLSNNGELNNNDKKIYLNKLCEMNKKISDSGIDDPLIMERIENINKTIESIPVKPIFPSKFPPEGYEHQGEIVEITNKDGNKTNRIKPNSYDGILIIKPYNRQVEIGDKVKFRVRKEPNKNSSGYFYYAYDVRKIDE